MSLTKRYVDEIIRYLPKDMQGEVSEELQGSLIESIEERWAGGEYASKEEAEEAVLRENGRPIEIAAKYIPEPNCLIGPVNLIYFKKAAWVLFLLVVVFHGLSFVGMLIQGGHTAASVGITISKAIHGVIGNYLSLLGLVALGIGFLERVTASLDLEWDPKNLPKMQEPQRIDRAGRVFGFVALLIILILSNFLSDYFRIQMGVDGAWHVIDLVSQPLEQQALAINVFLAAALLFQGWLLRRGTWSRGLRWLDLVLHIVAIALVYWLSQVPQLVQGAFGNLTEAQRAPIQKMIDVINESTQIGFLVVLVLLLISLARAVYRLSKDRGA